MKKLTCKDVSGIECSYEATEETNEETKKKLEEHGMEMHASEMAAMTEEQKMAMQKKMEELLAQQ